MLGRILLWTLFIVVALPVGCSAIMIGSSVAFNAMLPSSPEADARREAARAAREEARQQERAAVAQVQQEQNARRQAAEARERELGLHCMVIDRPKTVLRQEIIRRLRDPSSFDHIATRITPVNARGEHTMLVQFRARNGFGGLGVQVATLTLDTNCRVKTISFN